MSPGRFGCVGDLSVCLEDAVLGRFRTPRQGPGGISGKKRTILVRVMSLYTPPPVRLRQHPIRFACGRFVCVGAFLYFWTTIPVDDFGKPNIARPKCRGGKGLL